MASRIDVPQDEVLLPEGGHTITTVRTAELHVYVDNEREQNDRRRRRQTSARGTPPQPENRKEKLLLRLGYCCLIFPLFFAFSASAVSVVTLAVENYSLPDECDIQCLLSTGSTPSSHPRVNCWIVMGGGILVCILTILFIFTLISRLCCGAKMYVQVLYNQK